MDASRSVSLFLPNSRISTNQEFRHRIYCLGQQQKMGEEHRTLLGLLKIVEDIDSVKATTILNWTSLASVYSFFGKLIDNNLVTAERVLGQPENQLLISKLLGMTAEVAETSRGQKPTSELADILWGLDKLRHRDARVLAAISRLTEDRLGQFEPRSISSMAYSFRRLAWEDGKYYEQAAAHGLNRFSIHQQFSHLLSWGISLAGCRTSKNFINNTYREIRQQGFKAQGTRSYVLAHQAAVASGITKSWMPEEVHQAVVRQSRRESNADSVLLHVGNTLSRMLESGRLVELKHAPVVHGVPADFIALTKFGNRLLIKCSATGNDGFLNSAVPTGQQLVENRVVRSAEYEMLRLHHPRLQDLSRDELAVLIESNLFPVKFGRSFASR